MIKDFSLNAVTTHYVEAYADLKRDFVDLFSGFAVNGDDGTIEHAMSVEEAESYFDSITTSFIGLIAVISFLITGLTLKLYSHLILRFSKHGILKTFAHFLPSNFCAYLYIISTVLGWLASETSTFGIILININFILETVFLYMGLKYLVMISNVSQRKRLTYFLLALGILSFPSFVPSLISYLGVWVVIGTNLNNKASKV